MDEYYNYLWEYMGKHPQQRVGQCAFNALYDFHEDVANEIRATEFDPFYTNDPEKLKAFFAKVAEYLN